LDCRRAAAIQERVTVVLRSIPKEAFADSFQKLYERCQQCVVKDGNRIIPLMQRPKTDSAPNMPVTLPRNQLLILCHFFTAVPPIT
jgi:heterodisulfide reductase subunit C